MFIDRSRRKQVGRFVENSVTKFKRLEASPDRETDEPLRLQANIYFKCF